MLAMNFRISRVFVLVRGDQRREENSLAQLSGGEVSQVGAQMKASNRRCSDGSCGALASGFFHSRLLFWLVERKRMQ